ncbi:Rrf2 family transcriptional regulator [bacterium]|jgi:Rrf2 family transcriptional regulator, cysteine metabolism repressor|nr:Rrf2 family transcriptional regulator [bacterium]MBT4649140.1 Rrf2 family transcriptional regulator [bacterium]
MFNISAKADYGLIIMLELAKNHGQGYLAMSDISSTKKLSSHYLTQITKPLRQAKLLASKEGKTGGYTLSKNPDQITVLEIIEALEGKIKLNRHDCSSICVAFANCEAKTIWPTIMIDIKKLLQAKTLADLLKK